MFIGASVCLWILRSWKTGKIKEEAIAKRERERERGGNVQPQSRISLEEPVTSLGRSGLAFKTLFELERV